MGKFRRFMLPVALSIAVHAGIYSGASGLVAERQEPRITQKVMEEGPAGKKEEKKKPDLEALKKEREKYVRELFSALKEGKGIGLSAFLIRSESLEENIRLAEKGQFGPSEKEMLEKYAKILEKAKEYAVGAEDEVQALHEFLHVKVFAGYYFGSGSIIDVLGNGWYNCVSSTEMFTALMEDALGSKDHKVILLNDHLKSFLDGYEIENTAHEWKAAHKKFDGCGLVSPTDIFIGGYLVANGIGIGELPEGLSKLYEIKITDGKCPTKSKKTPDTKGSGARLPKPGVASGADVPSYFMPNPKYEITTESVVRNARGIYAAYRIAHMWDESEFVNVEFNGGEIELNPILVPGGMNWPALIEKNKSNSVYHKFHAFTPERTRHCSPEMTIPADTMPKMIEEDILMGDSRFEGYAREEICKKFERVLNLQKEAEVEKYLDYYFCEGLEERLKAEYSRQKRRSILWYGLGNFGKKENFEFFLNELKNAEGKIKSGAAVGMVLADKERACKVLKGLSGETREQVKLELIWGCEDQDAAWEIISNYVRGRDGAYLLPAAISDYDGASMSEARRNRLLELVPAFPLQEKMEAARILLERGDKENAFRVARGAVEEAKAQKETFPYLCGAPKEFIPVLAPLAGDPNYATGIAYDIIYYGMGREYLPVLKKSLRALLNDAGAYDFERERAAFALLMLGVDPLGKD